MTDTKELRALIQRSGYKYAYIASVLGLSSYGLQRKIDNLSEFKASEIEKLSTLLGIDLKDRQRIFFAAG